MNALVGEASMTREFTVGILFLYFRPRGNDGSRLGPERVRGNVMVFLEFGVCRVTITLAGTSDGQSGVDVVKGRGGKDNLDRNSSDEDIFFVVEYRRLERCERLTLSSPLCLDQKLSPWNFINLSRNWDLRRKRKSRNRSEVTSRKNKYKYFLLGQQV